MGLCLCRLDGCSGIATFKRRCFAEIDVPMLSLHNEYVAVIDRDAEKTLDLQRGAERQAVLAE